MEIRNGNTLLVDCQIPDHCCGMIRVPFRPTIGDAPLAPPIGTQEYWNRVSGETVEDISLTPSVDAGSCGHFNVENGQIKLSA